MSAGPPGGRRGACWARGAAVGLSGAAITKLIDDTLQARLEMNNLANEAGSRRRCSRVGSGGRPRGRQLKLVGGLQTLTDQAFKASQENEAAKKSLRSLGLA